MRSILKKIEQWLMQWGLNHIRFNITWRQACCWHQHFTTICHNRAHSTRLTNKTYEYVSTRTKWLTYFRRTFQMPFIEINVCICVLMSLKIVPGGWIDQMTTSQCWLTHWGQVTHIGVGKITTIGSDKACRLNGAKPLSEPEMEYC